MAAKSEKNFWGLKHDSLLSRALTSKPGKRHAEVIVQTTKKAQPPSEWRRYFADGGDASAVRVSDGGEGVRVLVTPLAPSDVENDKRLIARATTRVRDAMGALISTLERLEVDSADLDLRVNDEELAAAITGLEIAHYRYKRVRKGEAPKVRLILKHDGQTLSGKNLEAQTYAGQAVNLARHLVNLPPADLNPVSYAAFVKDFFAGVKGVKVEVWDEKRLRAEKMGLHLGVGQGSDIPPRFVHVRYRPSRADKRSPIALVGKGITFDTGGLDIKPSSGMRLMKKDMGGSASVVGLAYWAARTQLPLALDFYLALAENAVSGHAFRPSDVLTARNGLEVEVHNTDAEGRLVLADALDVAVTSKDKPRAVLDLATLTGAIKVALGSGLAGLFSNDLKLGEGLAESAQDAGDLVWPMPLFQKYRANMNSNFADLVNAVDGFGGAVTAALFLERFVKDVPWAHFDIYAWKDSADGCWLESGGSGQSVLGVARWLESQV